MRKLLSWVLVTVMLISGLSMAVNVSAAPNAAIVYGDVDGDGDVSMKDVLLVRKFIAGLETQINQTAADVNGDGSVDMKDVLMMRKFIANIITELNGQPTDPTTQPTQPTDPTTQPTQSTDPTTQPTQPTQSTQSTTLPTMPPITDSPVIYDEDVTAELSLKPGKTLELQDITDALDAETAKYGIAEQYIITVRCHALPSDYYYSILMGETNAEVWPDNNYDHDYKAGSITKNTVCVLVGQEFVDAGEAPKTLYFYADGENGTLFIEHIKIEVVRRSGTLVQPTSKTTGSTQSTQSTTRTTRTTQPGDYRPTGTGDYTYVGDTPYITFRSYGDECTLGTWWWGVRGDVLYGNMCDTYLEFLYMNGVDEIYFYGYYMCASDKAGLHSFVQKANAKGMAVSLIYDDADTITASGNKEMSKIATNYLNYCAAYPSDQMAGIHFDVEGVSRDNMVTNMISQFADARAKGVPIAMDVNCKWTSSKTLNGVSGFMNIVAANVDCLSLMSYQDTANGIWNLANNKTANPFGAAKTYGTKIVLGVEVGTYTFNSDSDEFYQEGKEICYTELAKVRDKLVADHPTGGYGLAVHAVPDWYSLKNK